MRLSQERPTEREIRKKAEDHIRKYSMVFNPVIAGMVAIPYEEIKNAHPFDLVVWDIVMRDKIEFEENRVIRAELVERRK